MERLKSGPPVVVAFVIRAACDAMGLITGALLGFI